MLTTIKINKLLKNVSYFNGVFAIDRLPRVINLPASMIVNLDKSYEPGSHWVALSISKNGEGHYFDSFGRPPSGDILTFLERNAKKGFTYNDSKIQSNNSQGCGYFCIFFILFANDPKIFYSMYKKCKHFVNEKQTLLLLRLILSDFVMPVGQ